MWWTADQVDDQSATVDPRAGSVRSRIDNVRPAGPNDPPTSEIATGRSSSERTARERVWFALSPSYLLGRACEINGERSHRPIGDDERLAAIWIWIVRGSTAA